MIEAIVAGAAAVIVAAIGAAQRASSRRGDDVRDQIEKLRNENQSQHADAALERREESRKVHAKLDRMDVRLLNVEITTAEIRGWKDAVSN